MENYCLECVENYKRVLHRVEEAAFKSGRNPAEVRLMAVTKTVAPDAISAVLNAGADLMGENRVQELQAKKEPLAHLKKEVHLIGHLQSNKAKYLPALVTTVQSIDSEKTARAVSKAFSEQGKVANVLLEVNIGGEASKSGVAPAQLEELLYQAAALPGLHVQGLMTIPPICEGEEARRYFQHMHKIYVDMQAKKIDNANISILSMGMTGDFESAILEGSTMVRVGTGIFGRREYK